MASTTTFLLLLLLLLLLLRSTVAAVIAPPPSPSSPSTSPTLDPKQLKALQSLSIPTNLNPCTPPSSATTCDGAIPFCHLLSLRLANCSPHLHLSTATLSSLSTLTSLTFLNCHTPLTHFPSSLATNLHSFTSVNSLRGLTGVFLSRLHNLTHLYISGDPIKASGVHIITSKMKSLTAITLSNANLLGFLPKHWNPNLTHIDLSKNKLKGSIPTSLTLLGNLKLLNLSSNQLIGGIPTSFGDLISLQNLSLSSNSLSGPIPPSISTIPKLVHLDLGSNKLNGTIPKFILEMKALKYLNLERNDLHGVMPFNDSFIERLEVFKIDGNKNLCYNTSTISKEVKLGNIAPCDEHGMPVLPPPAAATAADGEEAPSSSAVMHGGGERKKKESLKRMTSKIVLGMAIGLSGVVFMVVLLVLLSRCGEKRWCGCL